jgi:hypothetical protein
MRKLLDEEVVDENLDFSDQASEQFRGFGDINLFTYIHCRALPERTHFPGEKRWC